MSGMEQTGKMKNPTITSFVIRSLRGETLRKSASFTLKNQPQPDIFFRKLTETDDIEAYLTTFEWLVMSANLE